MDQYFNDSTGEGDHGEIDARGPWNEGNEWQYMEAPAFQEFRAAVNGGGTKASASESELLENVLVEELQDLLHAEGQVLKALPKMEQAARSSELKQAFQRHLEETQAQVERLKQSFELLGAKPKQKVCKGMQGLIEEGQERSTKARRKTRWLPTWR